MGGQPQGTTKGDVEILDVEERKVYNCLKPQQFPTQVYAHVGGVVDERLTICGGETVGAGCFQLDPENNDWLKMSDMITSRSYSAAAMTTFGTMNYNCRLISLVE